ncbi:MAG: glycosyltransferase family 2 protein [Flavobacteriales bacterium]|nr:glycosyltransferase family 2 protein [Flavobacteriales bacterium]MCB9446760.1 glycosyltransferase family 2 protein [Flavobacteriales bacterium]
MASISAVIITFNEERNIGRCLESIQGLADEIIVVDSRSTDNTKQLCESAGARFIEHEFRGYIEQKNLALTYATCEYVLSLDADEALSDRLKQNLAGMKPNLDADGYTFNRLTNYCGKWIRHCGWYPDTKMRLFRRGSGHWAGVNPHDRYALNPGLRQAFIAGDLLHYSFYTVAQHKAQARNFSAIGAQALYDKGIRSNWLKILIHPIAKFARNYLIKLGFLDGYKGLLICLISAQATYRKYLQLRKLGRT